LFSILFQGPSLLKRFKASDFASLVSDIIPVVSGKWCNWEGQPTSFVGPVPSPEQVAVLQVRAKPSMLAFRDPSAFVPGQLHDNFPQWEFISAQFQSHVEPLSFIRNKVDVFSFIDHFKGTFPGCATMSVS